MEEFEEQLEGLKQLILDSSRQNWLFGAGISHDANIPLMFPLTDRVQNIIDESDYPDDKEIIKALHTELVDKSHVEHYLSHLGDLIALSGRSKGSSASLDGKSYSSEQLTHAYKQIVSAIGETMRYGYKDEDNVGSIDSSIVDIESHLKFVHALFKNNADLERRSEITFFTTNYDTLLEDALALNKKNIIDGFSGGAMGFWNADFEFSGERESSNSCYLFKLHGSIDWHRDTTHGLVRARYGTKYISDAADIMIYPQATKYVETQKDPFATLFSGLRSKLKVPSQNVLITCGYSFGDEHINSEIEACLLLENSKTTVIAFTEERPDGQIKINPTLDRWLAGQSFSERIFVAGKNGIYNNSLTPIKPNSLGELNWWRFSGLTKLLDTGEI